MLKFITSKQARRRGGQEGAGAPPAFQLGEQGGAKVPFFKAMICFPVVNMTYQELYKLKTSNILLEKAGIYMTVRGIGHDIRKKCLGCPPFLG